jgi:hypothetical protein
VLNYEVDAFKSPVGSLEVISAYYVLQRAHYMTNGDKPWHFSGRDLPGAFLSRSFDEGNPACPRD